ncbi:16S rRNA (cytosine(967)-C(5))-methyltransferase RsmB [Listeria sp. PSOL-1]|uniref:16S rRNA (cytosine(967)-C(5))-methyltransferase RsmB n=1 Tax=Listeria sp. PSOL-1 TaxID=1844999 RepID=UPI0013D6CF0B|nr:16S rRNA (cytosine(967)-C(5))-methyltransferase RsmB [Listeria sp. PSOL-1]
MKPTIRGLALDTILKIEKSGSYSHLLINDALKNKQLKQVDKALFTELVYGTIQRKITLDYYLQPFLKKQPEDWVIDLLRMSVYQLVFLDKIPEHAILHEAGEIAKKRGHQGVTKFVNGVLRNLIRTGVQDTTLISDDSARLSVEKSLPLWLTKRIILQYGFQKASEIGQAFLKPPKQTVRVNMTETNPKSLVKEFSDQGIESSVSEVIPEAVEITKGTITNTAAFRTGKCTVQDLSSMVATYALQLKENLNVLDACAAPGGKTTHIAEKMSGTGSVTALDIHDHKIKLIKESANRLNLLNIRAFKLDARKAAMQFEKQSFDRILVDAPCSGLGVLRHKPDIKYNKTLADIKKLSSIQQDILNEVSQLVKENGILVYSTCTIDQEENQQVVASFLMNHPEFELIPVHVPLSLANLEQDNGLQLLPTDVGSDGFFVASFRRL